MSWGKSEMEASRGESKRATPIFIRRQAGIKTMIRVLNSLLKCRSLLTVPICTTPPFQQLEESKTRLETISNNTTYSEASEHKVGTSPTGDPLVETGETSGINTIPSEILMGITSHLPSTAFLPLMQTCHSMRTFFVANAAAICNANINARFPLHTELLQTRLLNGWLVPQHPEIQQQEHDFLTRKTLDYSLCRAAPSSAVRDRYSYNPYTFDCRGHHHLRFPLALSGTGPQFLHFLESYGGTVMTHAEMAGLVSAGEWLDITNNDERVQQATKKDFQFRLGNYVLRPFLERLYDRMSPASPVARPKKSFKSYVSRVFCCKKAVKARPARLFGEVGEDDHEVSSGDYDVKARLMWYFGESGALKCSENRLGGSQVSKEKPRLGRFKTFFCEAFSPCLPTGYTTLS